jgi:diguanylate cyclase (GGDEF)-like protein
MAVEPEDKPISSLKQRLVLDFMATITDLSNRLPGDSICRVMTYQLARLLEGDACLFVERPDCPPDTPQATAPFKIHWAFVPPNEQDVQWNEETISPETCPFLARCVKNPLAYNAPLDDAQFGPDDRAFFARFNTHQIIAAPVFTQNQFTALIVAISNRPDRVFRDQDVLLAHFMATQIGAFMTVAKMNQDLAEHSRKMEFLYQSSLSLTASLDLNEVLAAIMRCSFGVADGIRDAHIFLYDGQTLRFSTSLWADGNTGIMWAEPRSDGLTYTVARSGEMIYIPDIKNHPLFQDAPASWEGAILGLPLKIGNRVVGVMTMAFEEPRLIHELELRIFRMFADQAAISIENARLHTIINMQAHTDSLTGLPNRRSFDEHLDEEVRRSSRYRHRFTMVIVDIDHFKHINDTYGHPAGDEALKQVAACLRASTRDTDFVARYGGDEFTILFPETGRETAQGLLERIHQQIKALVPAYNRDSQERYSLSAGLATYPDDASESGELLATADRALYVAKRQRS